MSKKTPQDLSNSYNPEVFFPEVRLLETIEAIPDAAMAQILTQELKENYFIAENLEWWVVINEKKLLDFDPIHAINLLTKFWVEIPEIVKKQYYLNNVAKKALWKEMSSYMMVENNTLEKITILMIIRLFLLAFSTQKLYHREKNDRRQLTLREKIQEVKSDAWNEITNQYLIKAIRTLSKAFPREDLLTVLEAPKK